MPQNTDFKFIPFEQKNIQDKETNNVDVKI